MQRRRHCRAQRHHPHARKRRGVGVDRHPDPAQRAARRSAPRSHPPPDRPDRPCRGQMGRGHARAHRRLFRPGHRLFDLPHRRARGCQQSAGAGSGRRAGRGQGHHVWRRSRQRTRHSSAADAARQGARCSGCGPVRARSAHHGCAGAEKPRRERPRRTGGLCPRLRREHPAAHLVGRQVDRGNAGRRGGAGGRDQRR